ncbi:hypothetical protein JRO89_XS10G0125900 [Xanthoceras sorbifolium]|uniref:Uncharacterized protein n=1 Tax=Xanthoceras sorbifolium TaxID=99658 RepID=A0ABQ8HIE7_9ROSI|nr:hypothetical protein JRO89_XS10G0125900 [Xanthoceras sorbifolium]
MRGSGALVAATMVAASTAAALTSSSSANINQITNVINGIDQGFSSSGKNVRRSKCTSSEKEKFAPRFDGLRFIETLVTAHR